MALHEKPLTLASRASPAAMDDPNGTLWPEKGWRLVRAIENLIAGRSMFLSNEANDRA